MSPVAASQVPAAVAVPPAVPASPRPVVVSSQMQARGSPNRESTRVVKDAWVCFRNARIVDDTKASRRTDIHKALHAYVVKEEPGAPSDQALGRALAVLLKSFHIVQVGKAPNDFYQYENVDKLKSIEKRD